MNNTVEKMTFLDFPRWSKCTIWWCQILWGSNI